MAARTPRKNISSASTPVNFSMSTPIPGSHSHAHAYNMDHNIVSESRKRQSKRDEAIRRRVENDLSKKRFSSKTPNTHTRKRSRNYQPGTVLSLKPSEAVVCKPTYTAYEAAQLMGAKRENCILVVNDQDELLGIFTAKDLAFRVVGKGLSAGSVLIEQIMTPNPMCALSNTPASEALSLMVQKGFRHLPVIDEESNSIAGVLDITKCYQEAMEKLERMYESSKKLHDALEGVNAEIGISQQPAHVLKYLESLKSVMNGPTLESVLDDNTAPSYINVKTSVYEAAILMKENKTTAVLIKDSNDEVTGIFTSKDVVLRVIAAGLEPKTVSVVRVMTSQPDVAPKGLSIQAALRKMFNGHYLNLPVTEDDEIIGIVEVLKLTYATLNQITAMKSVDEDESTPHEGPAWNRFWKSLEETSSIHTDPIDHSIPDISQSEINQFSFNNQDALGPSDSISVTNEARSQFNQPSVTGPSDAVDFKDVLFSFKFKSPSGRNHRVSLKPVEGIQELRQLISSKLNASELKFLSQNDHDYAIGYIDDEGDVVAITNDQDLLDCALINRNAGLDKADLFIHHPDEEIDLDEYLSKKEKLSGNGNGNGSTVGSNKSVKAKNQLIAGVANEVVVSGAIVAVGAVVAVAVAFALGRK